MNDTLSTTHDDDRPITHTQTKAKGRRMKRFLPNNPRMTPVMRITSTVVSFMLLFGPAGFAGNLPSGGTVIHGNVGIGVDGHTMTLTQASQQAIMNWDSFSIGAGYGVNIDQPSAQAAMLARVVGGDPSSILGALTADGIFYLVNPNGVYFGRDASVDVGQLIATTLNLTDQDFLAGNLSFSGESTAAVENQGRLSADLVALLGRNVTNSGTIASRAAILAAASDIELGRIAGGRLTVDMSGLLGDAFNTGTIDASGATGGQVVMAGARVLQDGAISADGLTGDGGDVAMTASDVVGITGDSTTTANAGINGNGGNVTVLSDGSTRFFGTIEARGGDRALPYEFILNAKVKAPAAEAGQDTQAAPVQGGAQ